MTFYEYNFTCWFSFFLKKNRDLALIFVILLVECLSVNQSVKNLWEAFIYYAFKQEKLNSHQFGWINKINLPCKWVVD
jgi:hypothetical protein